MRVLIACEIFGVVRNAYRALGYDAWSCDILPSTSEYHIQTDVVNILEDGWDMMIAFPPCTYLCSSGLHWNKRVTGRQAKTEKALEVVRNLLNAPIERIALENPIGCISTKIRKYDQKIQPWQFGEDASKGTCLWLKNLPKLKHTKIIPPKGYSEIVFAAELPLCEMCEEPFCPKHNEHYADCGCIGPSEADECEFVTMDQYDFGTRLKPAPKPVWANQTPSGQNKLGPSPERAALRGKTYQGIAKAMAEQWG